MAYVSLYKFDCTDLQPEKAIKSVSPTRATELLNTGKWYITKDFRGKDSLQEYPPDNWLPDKLMGGFSAAWAIKASGGIVPCWQYVGHK